MTGDGAGDVGSGTMGEKLKSCPFCGGDTEFLDDEPWIECQQCGAVVSFPVESRDRVVVQWNRRATPGR